MSLPKNQGGHMNRTTPLLLTLFLAAVAHAQAPAKPPSTEDAQVAHVADAKWAPPKAPEIPAGAVASVIAVDPNTSGSLAYAQFPPGYALPPHRDSFAAYTLPI